MTQFIECKACHNILSIEATACPKCGHPVHREPTSGKTPNEWQRTRPAFKVIGVILAALFMITLALNWITSNRSNQVATSNATLEPAATPLPTPTGREMDDSSGGPDDLLAPTSTSIAQSTFTAPTAKLSEHDAMPPRPELEKAIKDGGFVVKTNTLPTRDKWFRANPKGAEITCSDESVVPELHDLIVREPNNPRIVTLAEEGDCSPILAEFHVVAQDTLQVAAGPQHLVEIALPIESNPNMAPELSWMMQSDVEPASNSPTH